MTQANCPGGPSRKQSGINLLCFVLALTAAHSFESIGKLYMADFWVGLVGLLGLKILCFELPRGWLRAAGFTFLAFPVLAFGLDLWNQVENRDVLRGLARNISFLCSILTSLFVLARYGFFTWSWLMAGVYVSQTINGLWEMPQYRGDLPYIVKFFWGSFLVTPLLLLSSRRVYLNCALMVLAGSVTFLLDCRSHGMLWIAAAATILGRDLFGAAQFSVRLLRPLVLALIVGVAYFVYTHSYDELIDRWEGSNRERTAVAIDAFENTLDRPWTGLGTWVHTLRYIDADNSDLLLGAHSALLLLSVEYGVFGFLVSLLSLALLALAFHRVFRRRGPPGADPWEGAVGILTIVLLEGIYITFFSPFYGPIRYLFGLEVGLALHIVRVTQWPWPQASPVAVPGLGRRMQSA